MPNPPVVPPPKNRPVIGDHPASANTTMTASPVPLWARDAALGMLLALVLPSLPGRTFSRPRLYMYRQTALWKARAAASRLVRNSHWAVWDSHGAPRPNISPGPWASAAATTCAVPAWTAMAHADPAYTSPITASAV